MARSTRRLLAIALAATSLVVPACAHAAAIGIDDPRASTFLDPTFKSLGIQYARLVLPWDWLADPTPIDRWIHQTQAAGIEPLVTFEHSAGDRCPSSPCTLPSLDQYGAAFDAFRARYPSVQLFSPWNEENHSSQPTATNPARAADYYNLMRARCPECTIVAADVLGTSDAPSWIATFRQNAQGDPQLWGLHNYPDLNYFTDSGTKAFLAAVPGEVWLTETGGIVSFTRSDGRIVFPYDEQRAANALTYLFQYLLPTYGDRISRVYIHEWRTSQYSLFDSGLISPGGTPRPALDVLRSALPQPAPELAAGGPGGADAGGGGAPDGGRALAGKTSGQVLQLLRLRVGRAVRATLRCTPGPNVCEATLRLVTLDPLRISARHRPMRVTVAHSDISIAPGRQAVATLRLTRTARRFATRHHMAHLNVIVTAGPPHSGFPRRPLTRTSLDLA